MKFDYTYTITYGSGQKFIQNPRKESMVIEVTENQYKHIVKNVLNGIPISEIVEIQDLLTKMQKDVRFVDRWKNLDGSSRDVALKKPRDIVKYEFFMKEEELSRLKKMSDPLAAFARKPESINVYRSDGSYITIATEHNNVIIKDSNDRGAHTIIDAEQFIQNLNLTRIY